MGGLISSAERRLGQSSDLANMTLSGARKPPADLGLGRTQVDKIKGMCHGLSVWEALVKLFNGLCMPQFPHL